MHPSEFLQLDYNRVQDNVIYSYCNSQSEKFHQLSHAMRKSVYAICEQQSADQPARPRILISAFVVRCRDSMIHLVSIPEI